MIFAKLFTLPNGYQILYTKNFDNESDEAPFYMAIRCDNDGVAMEMKLGFETQEKMDSAFESADENSAQKTFDNIASQFIS